MMQNEQREMAAVLDSGVYRALFEKSPDGILITDENGHLLECNATAHHALGYSREEFERLDLAGLNEVPDSAEAEIHRGQVMENGRTEFEIQQKTKDGKTRNVLITIQKLMLSGSSILLFTTWHDTSDCKCTQEELKQSIEELEEEKAKTEAIIHAIGEGISIRDRDYRVIYQNQITIDTVGLHIGELCYKAFHGRDQVCEGCPAALSFEDGKIHTAEVCTTINNKLEYFASTASPIKDSSGNIIAAIELIRNITEKKRSEKALQEANARLEALVNAIPDIVAFKDTQGRHLVVNKAVGEALGLPREEILGRVNEELFPSDAAAMCRASDEQAMNGRGPVHFEESMPGNGGGNIYLDTIKSPIYDEQGSLSGVVIVSRDITDRKRAEEALRLSEQRMFKAQRMAHVGNWEWSLGKEELSWSDEIYRIYGRDPESFIPTFKSVQETMHPEDLEPFLQGLDAAIHQGRPFEMDYRLIRPDGTERTIHTIGEVAYDPEDRPLGMAGTVQDVTERKRLEARAREQYATIESILENTDNPIFSVDRGYCYTNFNQRHATVMKDLYGAEIGLGESIFDFIPEESDRLQARGHLDRALNGEKVIAEDYFGREEQARLYEAAYNPIRDTDDQVVGVAVYARDTTERKRAEEQIKASEKRLRDITANLGVGVYVLDEKGKIIFMNPMAEQLWGWSLEELQENGVHDLVHCRRADGIALPLEECPILGVIRNGRPYSSKDEVFVRKDGTVFPISVTATPLLEEGRVVASVTAFRDITAEKQLEAELSKIQKLESVGILAGGIAHDFNNLLQAILGSTSLARLNFEQNNVGKIPHFLKQAEDAAEAAKELSFRLLTFAKGGAPVKTIASIEEIVGKSISLSLSGSNIACEINLPQDLPSIEVDTGQIMQVFNNILINAKEAMHRGGTIDIGAKKVRIPEDSPFPLKKGEYLHISIQDTGCGIPKENLPRIFDPYFSMKERGSRKGSGLGLSISMAIVRKHEGHISVESRQGQGTTFHIHLPASSEPPPVLKSEGKDRPSVSGKRILFMDDDERVRRLVKEMMASLGCEVECARHGEEAVTLYMEAQDEGKPFAGVVLDLTVKGGMGGDTTVAGLQEIDPQVKAVISSGYADNPVVRHFREYGFIGALPKPFTLDQLQELIAEF